MPDRRSLKLKKYHISEDHYQELFRFCKRYQEREKEIKELRLLSSIPSDGMPRGNTTGDPTAAKAIKIFKLQSENEMIVLTAKEADPYIFKAIFKNVTEGISYEYLDCPCSRGMFYDRRRKFFKLLSEKR
ncbi:MAG: hypothetical protein K0R00_916 [Herbinix sp.]|nr:hypothetical protein [Herbinix sp.]